MFTLEESALMARLVRVILWLLGAIVLVGAAWFVVR
jgi:hypothetical protein